VIKDEDALRESEQRFRNIFEEGPIGMVIVDRKFFFLRANIAFCTMLGYSERELTSLTFQDITHPEHRGIDTENVKRLLKGDIPVYRTEKRYIRKDGAVVWGAATITAIRNKNGNFLHFLSMIEDITERKKTEEALNNAQKLESLGVLAGGIAHDFNNLLHGIFGYIDMAAYKTQDKEVAEILAKALRTIDLARGLTQQLLTFAKGGSPIKKTENLLLFIHDAVSFALSGSPISCNFKLSENLWLCICDRNQIAQVINNLIINAQQAMPDGGTIEVGAENVVIDEREHPVLAAGKYIRLSIADHGIGMPKEMLQRIFDPFYTTKSKGHGLGLSTCYSIVKRHGGNIEVESEPGNGSIFYIYLPALSDSAEEHPAQLMLPHKGAGTILVMDDEAFMRETIESMLKLFGYNVICKKNGAEAIESFLSEVKNGRKLSALLFDLTIPGGKGGLETIVEIRKMDNLIPAFVTSGYADDPIMANPQDFGFTASISKPFRIAELAGILNKYLKTYP
jgi:PAS domain S-box-containing protein